MRDVLLPLIELPGVDFVMLLTPDGVPISVIEHSQARADSDMQSPATAALGSGSKEDAIAALASGWANELTHAVAPLSWDKPRRIVMRCARGSLVLRPMRGALLLLMLDSSMSSEDVRLPMDGAVARLERALRSSAGDSEPKPPIPSDSSIDSVQESTEKLEIPSHEGLSRD